MSKNQLDIFIWKQLVKQKLQFYEYMVKREILFIKNVKSAENLWKIKTPKSVGCTADW